MMKKISFIFIVLALVVVFRKFLLPGPLVFGDAPYFYKEGLKELVNLPQDLATRGSSLGGVNLFLWISPLMFMYGAFGTFLHLGNDSILRILFYLPSLVFGFIGVYKFSKYFKFSKTVSFFATLVYLINTYYLLLIDGGQVGVVLAYGFFPLVLYFLIQSNFLIALSSIFVLTIVDFRIAVICIFTAILINIRDFRKLKSLFFVIVCLLGLSMYWIIPTLRIATGGISTDVTSLQTTSLINSLFLSSPNWPTNQFGKINPTYFYFLFVPILIFLPLFFSKSKKVLSLIFLFLFFAFLTKGASDPLGSLYSFFVNTKFGSVFRDSTKFFIPLILFGGILIGISIEEISKRFKLIQVVCFVFILFLTWQGVAGRLNGVLGSNPDLSNYQKIYNLISRDKDTFFRDAWFDAKSPFAFHTEQKQALDAQDLVNFRPFASMNVGTGDRFNFINNKEYLDWFSLLGIKYLVFNGNPRAPILNESDQKDWDRLLNLVSNDSRLQKINIGTSFPIYKNNNILSNKFLVDKTFIVIGGDDVYQKLKNIDQNFSVSNQGFLFAEDGKLDLSNLQDIASTSAILVFDNKVANDLTMSFLQKDFVSPLNNKNSQWAVRLPGDYLNSKFELLTHRIDTKEYDYGKGIAFSTQKNETMQFKIHVDTDGEYDLIFRAIADNLKVAIDGDYSKAQVYSGKIDNNFEWFERDSLNLKAGDHHVVFENDGRNQVLNTLAFVPTSEMKDAKQLTQNFLGTFKSYNLENKTDDDKLKQIIETDKRENFDSKNITKPGWVIYTDTYNSNWEFDTQNTISLSQPMYSMINGFYVSPKLNNGKFFFKGDEYFRWGIYFSIVSFLIIAIVTLYKFIK